MKPSETDRPAPDPQRAEGIVFRRRSGAQLARRHFGEPESDAHRGDRLDEHAHDRNERISAEDDALDVAVRKSIRLYGA